MFRARYLEHGIDAFLQFLRAFCLFLFVCKVIASTVFLSTVFIVVWLVVNNTIEIGAVIAIFIVNTFLSTTLLYTLTKTPLECFGTDTNHQEGFENDRDKFT